MYIISIYANMKILFWSIQYLHFLKYHDSHVSGDYSAIHMEVILKKEVLELISGKGDV